MTLLKILVLLILLPALLAPGFALITAVVDGHARSAIEFLDLVAVWVVRSAAAAGAVAYGAVIVHALV